MEQIDFNYGDDRWSLHKVKVDELILRKNNFQVNEYRQRKYLFNDIPLTKGHKWQRGLFDTLLAGQPIPLIELNVIDELNKSIEDGQQRIKTIQAILNDCITVSDDVTRYGDEYAEWIGYHFSGLPEELQEKIRETELLVQSSEGLNEDELYQRFIVINNGTPLSAQDKRSGMNNPGAKYIQSLVDQNKYKMFETMVLNDKIQHKYVGVSTKGRELEEIIAHCFNYVRDKSEFKIGQPNLDKLYRYHFEYDNFDLVSISKKFEKYLKVLDLSIRNFDKPEMIGKKLVSMAFFVIKDLMDSGYKVDTDNFMKQLISVHAKLKQEDKPVTFRHKFGKKYPQGKKETLNYAQLFRLASTKEAVQTVMELLSEGVLRRTKYNTVDTVRSFTKEQRYSRWVEVGECCEYCGDSVEFEQSVADHREPHSEGGETVIENLAVACKKCNGQKSNMAYSLWKQVLPSLKVFNFKTETPEVTWKS